MDHQTSAAERFFSVRELQSELFGYLDRRTLIRLAKEVGSRNVLEEMVRVVYEEVGEEVFYADIMLCSPRVVMYRNAVRTLRCQGRFSTLPQVQLHSNIYSRNPPGRKRSAFATRLILKPFLEAYPRLQRIEFEDAVIALKTDDDRPHITETCEVRLPWSSIVGRVPGRGPETKGGDIPGYTHTRLVNVTIRTASSRTESAGSKPFIECIPRWAQIASFTDLTGRASLDALADFLSAAEGQYYNLGKLNRISMSLPEIPSLADFKRFTQALSLINLQTLDLCTYPSAWTWPNDVLDACQLYDILTIVAADLPALTTLKMLVSWDDDTDTKARTWRGVTALKRQLRIKHLELHLTEQGPSVPPFHWLYQLSLLLPGDHRATFGYPQLDRCGRGVFEEEEWQKAIDAFQFQTARFGQPSDLTTIDLYALGLNLSRDIPRVHCGKSGHVYPVIQTLLVQFRSTWRHETGKQLEHLFEPFHGLCYYVRSEEAANEDDARRAVRTFLRQNIAAKEERGRKEREARERAKKEAKEKQQRVDVKVERVDVKIERAVVNLPGEAVAIPSSQQAVKQEPDHTRLRGRKRGEAACLVDIIEEQQEAADVLLFTRADFPQTAKALYAVIEYLERRPGVSFPHIP